eukprot:NODE_2238_length_971_cov_19.466157.p5 GENE.NODE_2238_length_971_cov_19.466157~~NODE_2238_length_971_cov_19.466157.p5  ORF type:complete len:58 (-),score=2.16 NODE_2238_length_971_cov_19.466157:194-367(-)
MVFFFIFVFGFWVCMTLPTSRFGVGFVLCLLDSGHISLGLYIPRHIPALAWLGLGNR